MLERYPLGSRLPLTRTEVDADDARWVAAAELDQLPLTANLADYLRGAGILT